MSAVPMEPNSLPSVPAFARMVSLKSLSASARSSADDELLARGLLELRAARFELRDVVGRGERRLAFRQQEVAAEAGPHLYAVADVAEVGNLLKRMTSIAARPQCWSVYGSSARKRARLIATAS